ncbi:MAG TPA: hypothetical protein VF705_13280 [Longimicrobium sp.]|jgi:hypothetical protein
MSIIAFAATAGCGSPEDEYGEDDAPPARVVGDVFPESDDTLIVPDTVQAGVPFEVTVNTRGSSSCTAPAEVEVTMRGDTANLIPYDYASSGTCTADMGAISHRATLTFARPGHAVVRIAYGAKTLVEHKVVVRS